MKQIGQGWQYTTYDLKNGRVLKEFNSFLSSFFIIILDTFNFADFRIWLIPRYLREIKTDARFSLEIIKSRDLDPAWFGNIKVLEGLDIEQDMIEPLHVLFRVLNEIKCREIIDKFIDFNKKLLDKGIGDKTFNIAKNFGLNKNGEVIFMDIGEIYEGEKLAEQIRKKVWTRKYVVSYVPDHSQQYFLDKMEEIMKDYLK